MGFRKSTAEKCLNRFKKKFKDKPTHINGVMADKLRDMVISLEGRRGIRYWEFEDASCIYDIEKGKRNYLGEKISPLWYDHKARPYGAGERLPNIKGLKYYLPRDEDHRLAVAISSDWEAIKANKEAIEATAKYEKSRAELNRLITEFQNQRGIRRIIILFRIANILRYFLFPPLVY